MKHTIKAYVIYYQSQYTDKPTILLSHYAMKGDGFAVVREQEFEIDIGDFDPTATLIADLEEKKRQLRTELAKQLANIDQQISKLQALPMPAEF